MDKLTLDSLANRLDRLERDHRRLKRALRQGVIGQAGRTMGKVVEAEQFVLRDTRGRIRAALVVAGEPETGVGLSLYGVEGEIRAALGVDADGAAQLKFSDQGGTAVLTVTAEGSPRLVLGKHGKGEATLTVTDNDVPALVLQDKDGTGGVWLVMGSDDMPALELRDRDGKCLARLGRQPNQHLASLVLYDRDGRDRVSLSVEPQGLGTLMFLDQQGQIRVGLAAGPEDSSGLVLCGKDEKGRATLSVRPDGSPLLELRDKAETVVWKAP